MAEMDTSTRPDIDQLWSWLGDVPDPEIPVVSVVDLGIVRDVAWSDSDPDECLVTMTPTYSGCPATAVIAQQIREALHSHGIRRVRLQVRLSPAWTTDWMTPRAHANLHGYGIAPPTEKTASGKKDGLAESLRSLQGGFPRTAVTCPRCGAVNTQLISQFGSTPCKSLYRCLACQEPFDHFKCH